MASMSTPQVFATIGSKFLGEISVFEKVLALALDFGFGVLFLAEHLATEVADFPARLWGSPYWVLFGGVGNLELVTGSGLESLEWFSLKTWLNKCPFESAT